MPALQVLCANTRFRHSATFDFAIMSHPSGKGSNFGPLGTRKTLGRKRRPLSPPWTLKRARAGERDGGERGARERSRSPTPSHHARPPRDVARICAPAALGRGGLGVLFLQGRVRVEGHPWKFFRRGKRWTPVNRQPSHSAKVCKGMQQNRSAAKVRRAWVWGAGARSFCDEIMNHRITPR